MNSNDTRNRRGGGRGGRRPQPGRRRDGRGQGERSREGREARPSAEKKVTFWQKVINFFTGGAKRKDKRDSAPRGDRAPKTRAGKLPKPEPVEVTTPKLYVGNLSYEASESDLFELFNGVGQVQNAEVVTHRGTERSKGFGFVTMLTVDEARRAVEKLHDQPFMGRKLVVNGSRSSGAHAGGND